MIIAASVGACVSVAGIFAAFHMNYNNRKPAIIVAKSPKEDYFNARITVHNRNETAYRYKIRVDRTYLKWQSDIVSTGDKTIATLGHHNGSGVVLDEVIDDLNDHDIVLECYGWRPWPWSKVVYRQRFKNI